jgi:UDP-N-acetylglucosamine--N-acetylmuramyl-(pentapeptide) pyrophosphoryl-undecaprenol N-acetylglucosamine transferase
MSALRILIAGGGTGGHLFPGIAVAREILRQRPGAVVTFAGTARGIEARVVPREGFELDFLRSAGLKATSLPARARGISLLPVSGVDAWRILSRRAPDVVIGVGGYSSGPIVLAAAARGIPTLLLEQNAVPGITNRLLGRVVSSAAVTFDSTVSFFAGKAFVTGNPVRSEFFEVADGRADGSPRLLIFGGSQGAHAINVAMIEAAQGLAARRLGLDITHQTGERDLELVRDGYRRAGVAARVEAFLFDMAREMKLADLVVCRSGATTIAELTAASRPAIFIPLPTAADDHQRVNAQVVAAAGAAEVIEQHQLTGERLAGRIAALVADDAALTTMSAAARRLAHPDAAAAIVERVFELAARRAA